MKYELINNMWVISIDMDNYTLSKEFPATSEFSPGIVLTEEQIKNIIPDEAHLFSLIDVNIYPTSFIPQSYSITYTEDTSSYETKYLCILSEDVPALSIVWKQIAQALGLSLIDSFNEYVLPLTDKSAKTISQYTPNKFITGQVMNSLTDRIYQQNLGIPVLPAIIPTKDEDLDYFGNIPVFIKPRKTYGKSNHKYAYTTWDSPNMLRNTIFNNDLWNYQSNPDPMQGEFVLMPAIAHPLVDNIISFSVNEFSEVLFLKTQPGINNTSRQYGDQESYGYVDPVIQSYITKVCLDQQIKGGIHDVEFIEYNNSLVLMDWNVRPVYNTSLGRDLKSGIMVAAMAHMVGLPVPTIPEHYTVQRTYLNLQLPWTLCIKAKQAGIFARRDAIYLSTLAYTGSTKQECEDKLNSFELENNITR